MHLFRDGIAPKVMPRRRWATGSVPRLAALPRRPGRARPHASRSSPLQWEDVAFKKGDEQHGGKWTCIIKERKIMDEYWLNTCLALIGCAGGGSARRGWQVCRPCDRPCAARRCAGSSSTSRRRLLGWWCRCASRWRRSACGRARSRTRRCRRKSPFSSRRQGPGARER